MVCFSPHDIVMYFVEFWQSLFELLFLKTHLHNTVYIQHFPFEQSDLKAAESPDQLYYIK